MSLSCAQSQTLWKGYSSETLEVEERRAVREHFRDCSACREQAAATDPSLLFAREFPEEVSSEDTQIVLAGVRSGIAWKQAERRLALAERPARTWASVAVLALLVLLLPGNRAPRGDAAPVSVEPEAHRVAIESPATPAAAPAQGGPVGTTLPASATIYDWSMGNEQPRVVWIVDRSLDI